MRTSSAGGNAPERATDYAAWKVWLARLAAGASPSHIQSMPDLTDADTADHRRPAARHDRRRPLPAVTARAALEGNSRQAGAAGAEARAAAAAEAAGRAEHGGRADARHEAAAGLRSFRTGYERKFDDAARPRPAFALVGLIMFSDLRPLNSPQSRGRGRLPD